VFTNKPQGAKLAAAGNAQNVRHLRKTRPFSTLLKITPYYSLFAIPETVNGGNWKRALEPSAQIAADDPDDDGARRSRRAPSDSLPGRYQLGMPISGGSGGSICRYARYWHLMVPRAHPPARPRYACLCTAKSLPVFLHTLFPTQHAPVACIVGCLPGQGHGLHNRAHRRSTTRCVAPNNKNAACAFLNENVNNQYLVSQAST